METWKAAHEELMREVRWDIVVSNITAAITEAPQLFPALWEQILLFRNAVNWSDPFFSYLGALLSAMYVTALILCWHWAAKEARLLVFSSALIVLSSSLFFIMGWLHEHGNLFFAVDSANYFDEAGLFVAVVIWLPTVICAGGVQLFVFYQVLKKIKRTKRGLYEVAQPKVTEHTVANPCSLLN